MSKVLSIMKTEYIHAVRSKAFIIGVTVMPIVVAFMIFVQHISQDKVNLDDRTFAVVDHSEKLFQVIQNKANQRNENQIYKNQNDTERKQHRPRFLPVEYQHPPDQTERIDLVLSDRVRKEKLFAFLIIPADVLSADKESNTPISYYTNTPSYEDLPNWLETLINNEIKRIRFEQAGIDDQLVKRLIRRVPVKEFGLTKTSEKGKIVEAEEKDFITTFGVSAVAMMLLMMSLMLSSPNLVNAVLEEKMLRISEWLISSVPPFQLMLGKILGTLLVSATLVVLYIAAAVYLAIHFGVAGSIPTPIYFWFTLYFLLAHFMYGAIFAGIGAACSELKDAQALMTPAMIVVMIPFFCWNAVLQAPNAPFAVWVSLFPPSTPMLMLGRLAVPPGPPLWQVALSILLTIGFTICCVWAGAKIFRIGILSHGQAPSFTKLIRWVFSK